MKKIDESANKRNLQNLKNELLSTVEDLSEEYKVDLVIQVLDEVLGELKSEKENEYGFKFQEDSFTVTDRFGNHWSLNDWQNSLVDSYVTEEEAIVDFVDRVLPETGVDRLLRKRGIDLYDYAIQFTDYAQRFCDNYIA